MNRGEKVLQQVANIFLNKSYKITKYKGGRYKFFVIQVKDFDGMLFQKIRIEQEFACIFFRPEVKTEKNFIELMKKLEKEKQFRIGTKSKTLFIEEFFEPG